jgi:hypothetical protein
MFLAEGTNHVDPACMRSKRRRPATLLPIPQPLADDTSTYFCEGLTLASCAFSLFGRGPRPRRSRDIVSPGGSRPIRDRAGTLLPMVPTQTRDGDDPHASGPAPARRTIGLCWLNPATIRERAATSFTTPRDHPRLPRDSLDHSPHPSTNEPRGTLPWYPPIRSRPRRLARLPHHHPRHRSAHHPAPRRPADVQIAERPGWVAAPRIPTVPISRRGRIAS